MCNKIIDGMTQRVEISSPQAHSDGFEGKECKGIFRVKLNYIRLGQNECKNTSYRRNICWNR